MLHPDLLAKAKFVASTARMHEGRRFNEDIGIQWLSRSDILFCTFEPGTPSKRIVSTRNVVTGLEKVRMGLTESVNSEDWETVDYQSVSPDGKWFVRSGRWNNCVLTSIDCAHRHTYPSLATECYRNIYWLSDSRHWLEAYVVNWECKKLILHDVLKPGVSTSLPIANHPLLFGHLRAVPALSMAISIKTPEEEDNPQSAGILTITRFDLVHPDTGRKTSIIPVPGGAEGCTACVAPDGKRIAWCTVTPSADPIRMLLHRFKNSIDAHVYARYIVYVSAIDGSEMREIGEISERDPDRRIEIGWLPTSNSLTVEYSNSLYVVELK